MISREESGGEVEFGGHAVTLPVQQYEPLGHGAHRRMKAAVVAVKLLLVWLTPSDAVDRLAVAMVLLPSPYES